MVQAGLELFSTVSPCHALGRNATWLEAPASQRWAEVGTEGREGAQRAWGVVRLRLPGSFPLSLLLQKGTLLETRQACQGSLENQNRQDVHIYREREFKELAHLTVEAW